MQYKIRNKNICLVTAVILSLASMTIGCAVPDPIATNPTTSPESINLVFFGTINSEIKIAKFKKFLEEVENPKKFQLECDQKSIAKSCYYYASYFDLILKDNKESYEYYKEAYDLGIKQAGYFVGVFQINYPEVFNVDTRLSIDESIHYLEQAFKADSPDATRILMMTYRDPQLNRIDYEKSEYYNKIAIEQKIKHSRFLLASLYANDIKDKSKIDESIKLYKDDLIIEKNWQSSLVLINIYLNPKEYGSELNYVKALSYAYITRDLRKDVTEPRVANVENDAIELLPRSLTPEQMQQAKALYLELMVEINREHINK